MSTVEPQPPAPHTVTLHPVEEADRLRLFTWRNSADVAPFMYTDHQITAEEHNRWFDGLGQDPSRLYWVICLDGVPVGLANFADIDLKNRRCAWAYYLASPSVRGLGVGSFVEFWMIEYAFNVLKLEKLWCEVLLSNEAVWKLHQNYGFQQEALFRGHVIKEGEPRDVVGLGLLTSEWAARREAMRARLADKGYVA
ncbi:UDP-4-amino-4,6-dideoxy-N-acetyl-beta-L-altrosamine N-acetyltransferase [Caulobacter sp.]|uniref:UDP-4-amino-4, 6-dideoxy-N-acetyl-beta-L-altrosamine N-acetyltransferase n=1 Tax=Caulobacter sp. TaxID=78 RepID=UPI003BAB3E4D